LAHLTVKPHGQHKFIFLANFIALGSVKLNLVQGSSNSAVMKISFEFHHFSTILSSFPPTIINDDSFFCPSFLLNLQFVLG
jgi:hypothetical protein